MERSRAETNALARASITRIVAGMSIEMMHERGWKLATVRSLPSMSVLRAIPFGNADALGQTLRNAWPELGTGNYLLTVGDGSQATHVVVSVNPDGTTDEVVASLDEVSRALAMLSA